MPLSLCRGSWRPSTSYALPCRDWMAFDAARVPSVRGSTCAPVGLWGDPSHKPPQRGVSHATGNGASPPRISLRSRLGSRLTPPISHLKFFLRGGRPRDGHEAARSGARGERRRRLSAAPARKATDALGRLGDRGRQPSRTTSPAPAGALPETAMLLRTGSMHEREERRSGLHS